jgi:hypothetical protein
LLAGVAPVPALRPWRVRHLVLHSTMGTLYDHGLHRRGPGYSCRDFQGQGRAWELPG